ncbi:MAG TPA: hypothetical protein VGA49_02000 [Patescibacteria group bacterium]
MATQVQDLESLCVELNNDLLMLEKGVEGQEKSNRQLSTRVAKFFDMIISVIVSIGKRLDKLEDYDAELGKEVFTGDSYTLLNRVNKLEQDADGQSTATGQPIRVAVVSSAIAVAVSVLLSVLLFGFLLGNDRQQITSLATKVNELTEKAETPQFETATANQDELNKLKERLTGLEQQVAQLKKESPKGHQKRLQKLEEDVATLGSWIDQLVGLWEKVTSGLEAAHSEKK